MQVKELYPKIQLRYSDVPGDKGMILEQNPVAGTIVKASRRIDLVVSRGPSYEQTRVPNLVGMTVQEILAQMSRSKIAFNFSARPATQDETADGKAGTVVTQAASGEFIPNYGRLAAEFGFPTTLVNGNSYGIFTLQLLAYPYALNMEVRAVTPNGTQTTLTSFSHPGGQLTVPYALPKNSQLILLVEGRETARAQVQ